MAMPNGALKRHGMLLLVVVIVVAATAVPMTMAPSMKTIAVETAVVAVLIVALTPQ